MLMVTTSLGDVIETKHISFRILPTFCNFVIYGARKPNPNLNQNYRTKGSNIINMVELKFTTIFPPPPQKNTDFYYCPQTRMPLSKCKNTAEKFQYTTGVKINPRLDSLKWVKELFQFTCVTPPSRLHNSVPLDTVLANNFSLQGKVRGCE